MEQKLKNPAFDQKTLDELFIEDSEFQELIKVESISDSNKNPIPEKLAYSVKLLRALIEILKPSKNTKGKPKRRVRKIILYNIYLTGYNWIFNKILRP